MKDESNSRMTQLGYSTMKRTTVLEVEVEHHHLPQEEVHQVHPDRLGFRPAGFDRLAGGSALRERIQGGAAAAEIVREWHPARDAWLVHRRAALLYP